MEVLIGYPGSSPLCTECVGIDRNIVGKDPPPQKLLVLVQTPALDRVIFKDCSSDPIPAESPVVQSVALRSKSSVVSSPSL